MPKSNKAVCQLGRPRARYNCLQDVQRRAQHRANPDNDDSNVRNVGREDENVNIDVQEQEQFASVESGLNAAVNHENVARPLLNTREAIRLDPSHAVVPAQEVDCLAVGGSFEPDFNATSESRSDAGETDDSDHDVFAGSEALDSDGIDDAVGGNMVNMNDDETDDFKEDCEQGGVYGDNMRFRPLYRGAHITVSESVSTVQKFMIDHNLDFNTVEGLFELIQLHCPQEGLLKPSTFKLKQHFSFSSGPVKKHYYCSSCRQQLNLSQDVCPICKSRLGVSNFIQTPIIPQLKEMLSRPTFYNSLHNRFNRQRISEGWLEDIYDGAVYREQINWLSNPNNFSMTYFVKRVQKVMSRKVSVWGFYLRINELPYKERMKMSNTLLAGIWLGQKPDANLLMSSFLDDFRRLLDGVNLYAEDVGHMILVRGMVIAGVADTATRSTFYNGHHNGLYGCPLCEIVGESVRLPSGSVSYSYRYVEHQEERTVKRVFLQAEQAVRTGETCYGIKGPTLLRLFMPNYLRGTVIDVKHLIEEITRTIMLLQFNPKYSTRNFSLRPVLGLANDSLLRFKLPKFIHRFPSKLDNYKYWNSSKILLWFFYYSVVVLKRLMRPELYDHYLKLVIAVSYLNARSISKEMIDTANKLLHEFVKDFEILYGQEFCSISIHMLLHLSKCTSELGPMHKFSCVPYEHNNGQISKDINGETNLYSQVTGLHWQTLKLPNQFRTMREGPVKDYCLKGHGQLKITERVQETCFVVGCYSVRELYDPIIAHVLQNSNLNFRRSKSYTQLLKKDLLYVSDRHFSDSALSMSSCAAFHWEGTKLYGCIYIFVKGLQCECDSGCNCEGDHFAIIKRTEKIGEIRLLKHQTISLQYMHEARMTFHFLAVPVRNLITVCFKTEVSNIIYIAEPVNDSKNE